MGRDDRMRVMVTGATGFIGGHVLAALVAAGHEPVALVRNADKLTQMKSLHGLGAVDIAHVVGDILDADTVQQAVSGCDAVIHSAAFTTLDPAEMDKCLEINEPGTRIVMDAAVAAGCDPIIYMSTMSCIFPPVGDVADPDVDPVHSSDAPYSKSKADAEIYARDLQASGQMHHVSVGYDVALRIDDHPRAAASPGGEQLSRARHPPRRRRIGLGVDLDHGRSDAFGQLLEGLAQPGEGG